jgi:hypothetical protein
LRNNTYVDHVGLVHRPVCWKHKNIKTYLSHPNIPEKYLTPSIGTKNEKHSFAHTFCTKIKEGRLKKGGASTANPKKNITMVEPFAWSSGMAMVPIANRSWQPLYNGLVEGTDKGFHLTL